MIKMCIVCIAAGLASGVGVGFVGMSAATAIAHAHCISWLPLCPRLWASD